VLQATGATAFIDFSDLSFTSATISAQAAVIYNSKLLLQLTQMQL
jgi:hypothetical protein